MRTIRKFNISVAVILILTLPSCQTLVSHNQIHAVVHVVMLWLKRPGNTADRETIVIKSKRLLSIPGVRSIRIGTVLPSNRRIVDSSFDVGLVIEFRSADDMKRYLKHPIHKRLVEKTIRPRVKKIQVYDFIQIKR